MAITRRQFLQRAGMATAGGLFGPQLFRNPLLSQALASTIGDRYFVVLFLDGGNDGLNTIVPVTGALRAPYEAARLTGAGGLRIVNPLVPNAGPAFLDPNTGGQLGFHPGLAGLRDLYEQNMLAVIQGCGYPEYSLSHEQARSIWERGNPFGTLSNGWMGRYLEAPSSGYLGSDIPAVNIGDSVAGEYLQSATSVLVFDRLNDFGFPYDDYYDDDYAAKDALFSALHANAAASGNSFMQYLSGTGASTLTAAQQYPELHDQYIADRLSWSQAYTDSDAPGLNTSTARGLREVAKVIYGVARGTIPSNLRARFFQLHNGGYDTHSNQGAEETDGDHFLLHQEIAQSIKLFYQDLADMASGAPMGSGLQNLPDKVVLVVWSEFSRRIQQNDNGTDHGSQGPMLVVGGPNAINGGIYGNHPDIANTDDNGNTPYSQNNGDGFRSTDFRDVYGTIMKHWLGLANPSPIFPLDSTVGLLGDEYWNTANFNLPFL
ncbi:MAG: DUF1501 domain-containing protein [Deltaproteobacteria bacterium]|nr:DUF1501 domain-containing protein [Deltaproteobacteria bacterium]